MEQGIREKLGSPAVLVQVKIGHYEAGDHSKAEVKGPETVGDALITALIVGNCEKFLAHFASLDSWQHIKPLAPLGFDARYEGLVQ